MPSNNKDKTKIFQLLNTFYIMKRNVFECDSFTNMNS